MKQNFIEICTHSYITHTAICFLSLSRSGFFIVIALSMPLFSHSALAVDFTKSIKPYASYGVIADDNMLRIRDRFNPQFIENERIRDLITQGKLADVSHRFTGGVMFEKEISRQRLTADLSWSYNKYERFHDINHDLKNIRGNWNWFVGNRLEGNMGATYVQSLMPFIFQPGIKTIRTEQTQFINAAWRFHPSWSLNGEYLRYDLNTDSPLDRMRFLGRTEDRFEGGIDYVTASRNLVGVFFRNIIGDFSADIFLPDGTRVDNGYDQKEVMSKIVWAISEKSRFLWNGGWVERKNKSFPERDFSGFNARLLYNWQLTDKVGLTINGWRLTSSPQNLTAGFSLNTGVSVIPSWNITQKVRLEGEFSYETRKFDRFRSLTDPTIAQVIGQNNTFRNATLRINYNPYLGLQFSTAIYHSDVSSDSAAGGFNANGVTANLQYVYGQRSSIQADASRLQYPAQTDPSSRLLSNR